MVNITEEMIDAALDAYVDGNCSVSEYLDFNGLDAASFGIIEAGKDFAKLDIIRSDQWRDCQRYIMKVALEAAFKVK